MAGIGFQLKKLINSEKSFFHKIRTYSYSMLVIYGPLIMCIFCISYIQGVLRFFDIAKEEVNLFSYIIGYIFSASNVTTGIIALVLTRYVSDAIYLKSNKKVIPSLYGGIIITLVPGMFLYWGIVAYLKVNLVLTILSGIFFGLISVIWILLIYLGALSDHRKILRIFIIGTVITLVSLFFCGLIKNDYLLYYILISMDLGFTIIGSLLFMEIKNYFGEGEGSIWEFTEYIKKFTSLIFINIFYVLGLYFEGFYNQFFSPNHEINYLEILFISSFVLIPGMMYFIIQFETSYFERHNILLNTINKMGTYEDISIAKDELLSFVKFEFKILFRVVFTFAFVIMLFGYWYFLLKGSSINILISFSLFALGMCFTVLVYVVKIIFLYFDLRKHVLVLVMSFFILNASLTIVASCMKVDFIGGSILASAIISLIIGWIELTVFFKKMDYYLFKAN